MVKHTQKKELDFFIRKNFPKPSYRLDHLGMQCKVFRPLSQTLLSLLLSVESSYVNIKLSLMEDSYFSKGELITVHLPT